MDAGRGAQEQADKAARAVEEARRKLEQAEQRERAWAAGAEGERRTAVVLASLTPDGWLVLHDLHWPGRPFANIDHIAVGPGGVVVIDSKNWSGRVEVRDGVLRQNGYPRTQECEAAAAAAGAVAAWLEPQHRSLVSAMLCLVGQPTPATQPMWAAARGLDDLAARLRAMPQRLTRDEVWTIADYLRRLLSGDRSPAQTTTAALAAASGVPVREPSARARRSSASRSTAPRRTASPRRSSQPSRRRGRKGTSTLAELFLVLLKLSGIAFLLLVLLPAWLRSVTHQAQSHLPLPTPVVTTTVPAHIKATPAVR